MSILTFRVSDVDEENVENEGEAREEQRSNTNNSK